MSNEKGSGRSDEELAAQWGEALSEQDGDSDWGAALDEQKKPDNIYGRAKPVKLEELSSEGGHSTGPADLSNPDLDVILDIPVTISMEVGSTPITIRNLLQLSQGSVIELDRLAGEPLDVLVNGTLIAHGEVVVVNEKFGIRMTDVVSPSERINRLR
ncbi:MAG TPA: flagellar motor switch protein FliN [Pseudomonadales bacterium]|mgnify:FL=1|jgi:flagellar motor switch protein FliN/FliY|nr:flagellar motor switch protein FliN [Pseudomonadales bacterium]HMW15228.1 flagellar motor switch protein FliN [Pseudomonadales bacterium]HMW83377.1 flagellar motor switch protein FliN [Pseudomonadales bacterium]HMY97039.1 flagellar motor switch protein FliN [Pseudomonadales bacterium]HMZ70089.1 flagellar motor switch protein FliN [Pseudomonadales bacterium]